MTIIQIGNLKTAGNIPPKSIRDKIRKEFGESCRPAGLDETLLKELFSLGDPDVEQYVRVSEEGVAEFLPSYEGRIFRPVEIKIGHLFMGTGNEERMAREFYTLAESLLNPGETIRLYLEDRDEPITFREFLFRLREGSLPRKLKIGGLYTKED